MKKLNLFGTLLLATLLFTACGGNTIKEKTIKASDIAISGDGSEYIKVVDGEYTIQIDGDKIIIPIKLELTKSVEIENPFILYPRLIPLDKSGASIGYEFEPISVDDSRIGALLRSEVGKVSTISFTWPSNYSVKKVKKKTLAHIMEQTENFEIIRFNIGGRDSSSDSETEDDSDEEDVEETVASSDSEDWDEILDEYEDVVDQYIKLLKKSQDGDIDALTGYLEMMEKATDLYDKMNEADDLSTKQLSRLEKIQTKFIKAAADL